MTEQITQRPHTDEATEVDALLERARPLEGRDPTLGLTLSYEALERAGRIADPKRCAEAHLSVGLFAWRVGRDEEAVTHLEAALAHFLERQDARGRARCHGNLGNVLYRKAQYAPALKHYLQALELSHELQDPLLELAALNCAGSVYEDLGDYAVALEYRLRTLRHAESLAGRASLAAPLTNLGNTYQRLQQHRQAVGCYERALVEADRNGSPRNEMLARLNLGSALTELGRDREAIECLERAVCLAVTLRSDTTHVWSLTGLMRAHARLEPDGALVTARALRERARPVLDGLDAPDCAVGLRRAFGEVLAHSGHHDEALGELREALEVAQRHGLRAAQRDVHELLADALERGGDPAGALVHFRAHHTLQRDLHDETAEQRAQVLAVQHEVDRMTALNEALARQNHELRRIDAERMHLLDLLREQAERDDLTGLVNRRAFRAHLDVEHLRARDEGARHALILADIDEFKRINDRYSHSAGDAVLREIARLLGQAVRASDVVARYGGEEFALLLPGADHETARQVAERARTLVETHDWSSFTPGSVVTMSFGTCADTTLTGESMVDAADARLYAAKRGGRNRVE